MAPCPVEKAARKELRLAKYRAEDIVLVDNGTLAFVVAKHLLTKIFPREEVKIGEIGLLPLSRDELNVKFLVSFLEDAPFSYEHVFLSTIAYDNLAEYAKKNELECTSLSFDANEQAAYALLKQLEAEQPQTMQSLRKSVEAFRKKPLTLNES